MKTKSILVVFSLALTMVVGLAGAQQGAYPIDRTMLPIPEPTLRPITTLDARDAKAPILSQLAHLSRLHLGLHFEGYKVKA